MILFGEPGPCSSTDGKNTRWNDTWMKVEQLKIHLKNVFSDSLNNHS